MKGQRKVALSMTLDRTILEVLEKLVSSGKYPSVSKAANAMIQLAYVKGLE